MPPAPRSPGPATGAPDPKIAERVRALLVKAESTSFPEEAEAFTAKAQELMAKYAIDQAVLEQGGRVGAAAGGVRSLRIDLDVPYGSAKSSLLGSVARANRCQAVWDGAGKVATVFGYPADLEAVELLFTSLLTQATSAMLAASPPAGSDGKSGRSGGLGALGALGGLGGRGRAGGRGTRSSGAGQGNRTRSFRHAFLLAFANRVGERLAEATRAAVHEASHEHGSDLTPVLVRREEAVEQAMAEAFPRLRTRKVSVSNGHGWRAGHTAADQADLGRGARLRAG